MAQPASVPDWGPPGPPRARRRVLAGALGALLGIGGLTLSLGPRLGWRLTAAAGAGLLLALHAWWRAQGRRALRAVAARRLEPGEEPRMRNLAEGIAAELGLAPPSLWLISAGGANALVCQERRPVVAVTRGLLERYSRTEQEAVIAHCLVRIASADQLVAALGVVLGPLGRRLARCLAAGHDFRAAAVTRYPPALASALEKAEPKGGGFEPFWFAPADEGSCGSEARARALGDL